MSETRGNETICLKQFISEKDYKEITLLEELCFNKDKTKLKLELDYKIEMAGKSEIGLREINEFMYFIDGNLVSYIGISSFGGSNIAEINGMTHPEYRRKGLFRKLFELAMQECEKREFDKVLLLTDGNSSSGVQFAASVSGEYSFSEYRMKYLTKTPVEKLNVVKLRKASRSDGTEIARQNAIFFNHSDEFQLPSEDLYKTYMIERNETVIGKIMVSYSEHAAFISGFGIMPDSRGNGFGKAALKEALRLINENNIYEVELDVECKNNTALNLYKACGFEELSVMNYYTFNGARHQ
ncbi:MAG: GNAT family N-acetyltransferase [Anaerobacillus sp.]|uniref:GNAT family N-acetyltransferase n=1 Tax=Anaerobacillus sp. TaxID=1872506 RepID=UPI00391BA0C7